MAADAGVADAEVVDAGVVDIAVEAAVFADVATVVAVAVPVQSAADLYYTVLVMAQRGIAGSGDLPVDIQRALQPRESSSVSGCCYKSSVEAPAQRRSCQPLAGERSLPKVPQPG